MYSELVALALALYTTHGEVAKKAVELHPVEEKIIERTNVERQRRGLRPLRVDHELVRSARHHAAWMTRTRTLRHTSRSVGENIAMGQPNSTEAVRAWMNSPGHRANMLSNEYSRIGVAAYVANDGTIYWCQQFLR